jgi:hypothetical protein
MSTLWFSPCTLKMKVRVLPDYTEPRLRRLVSSRSPRNDLRPHKCSVATIPLQDSPINQTLRQIVFTLIMKYIVSGSVPKIA